jgi:hypothetical protein
MALMMAHFLSRSVTSVHLSVALSHYFIHALSTSMAPFLSRSVSISPLRYPICSFTFVPSFVFPFPHVLAWPVSILNQSKPPPCRDSYCLIDSLLTDNHVSLLASRKRPRSQSNELGECNSLAVLSLLFIDSSTFPFQFSCSLSPSEVAC